jgi:hypothetical protein
MASHTALFLFLVVIASIVAEHYTGNILSKGNQFNTKVDYFLGYMVFFTYFTIYGVIIAGL